MVFFDIYIYYYVISHVMGASTESNIISIPPLNKTIRLVVYSLIILLALITPITPAIAETNTIVNGGFEDGLTGWTGGSSWYVTNAVDSYTPHSGEKFIGAKFQQSGAYFGVQQQFNVTVPSNISYWEIGFYYGSVSVENLGTGEKVILDTCNSNVWVKREVSLDPGSYVVRIGVQYAMFGGFDDFILTMTQSSNSVADIDVIVSPIGEPTYVVRIKPGNDYDPDDHFIFHGVAHPGWHPPYAPFPSPILDIGLCSEIASSVDSSGYYEMTFSQTFPIPLPDGVYTVTVRRGNPSGFIDHVIGSETFIIGLGGGTSTGNTSTGSGFLNTSGLLTPVVINSTLTNTGGYTGNNTAIHTYYNLVYNLINGLNVKIMDFISWLISPIMKFSSYVIVGTSLFSDHVSHMLVFLEPLGIMILAVVNALPGSFISIGVFVLCCLLLMVVMGVQ